MCFSRKPELGNYNATRSEWLRAYRSARVNAREGMGPDPVNDGVTWKAELIVSERSRIDPLIIPGESRLAAFRVIEEILSEQKWTFDFSLKRWS